MQHKAFLKLYGLTNEDVPLLTFDPNDWDYPFSVPGQDKDEAHAADKLFLPPCPEWCATWHCDGAAWCNGGQIPAPCQHCKL